MGKVWLVLLVVGCQSGPRILSPYGSRLAVSRHDDGTAWFRDRPHDGVDVGLDRLGDPVIASADGIVTDIRFDPRSGTQIVIEHASGDRTGYVHLQTAAVRRGDMVSRGAPIGTVGLFPYSGQVIHVHWQFWNRDTTRDPLPETVGCFDPHRFYPHVGSLVLTYPVAC